MKIKNVRGGSSGFSQWHALSTATLCSGLSPETSLHYTLHALQLSWCTRNRSLYPGDVLTQPDSIRHIERLSLVGKQSDQEQPWGARGAYRVRHPS